MATYEALRTDSRDVVGQIVRLALLVRLAALAAGVAGLVGQQLSPQVLVAVLLLSASSFAGLTQPRFLAELIHHPMLATADVALVVLVFVVLGVQSPLSLAALSTSFLVGLLYRPALAGLLTGVLALSYTGQALIEYAADDSTPPFLLFGGLPVTFCCLAWIGHAVVRMHQAQLEAEGRLADLVQASAAADERGRLAREMHDSLAKSLQGLAFGAAALPGWVEKDGDRARTEASALAANAQQAVAEARTLLTRMRSDAPLRPFHEVVGEVLAAWGTQHAREVRPALQPVSSLSPDVRYELMAGLREALENIRRHAPDGPVTVYLGEHDGGVGLLVQDAGPGFDPQGLGAREAAGHFGVRGMYERMETVGGRADVRSESGQGVQVEFWVPQSDPSLLPPQ